MSRLTRSADPAFRVPSTWLPIAVLVVSAALAIAVWISRPAPSATYGAAEINTMQDAEVLASREEPDIYTEDLAFYEWANDGQAGR